MRMAFSVASAPPLVKNTCSRSPGASSAISRAASLRASLAMDRGDRAQLVGLLLDRGDELGVLVADVDVDQLAGEVEIAGAVLVPEPRPRRAGDRRPGRASPAPTTSGTRGRGRPGTRPSGRRRQRRRAGERWWCRQRRSWRPMVFDTAGGEQNALCDRMKFCERTSLRASDQQHGLRLIGAPSPASAHRTD